MPTTPKTRRFAAATEVDSRRREQCEIDERRRREQRPDIPKRADQLLGERLGVAPRDRQREQIFDQLMVVQCLRAALEQAFAQPCAVANAVRSLVCHQLGLIIRMALRKRRAVS